MPESTTPIETMIVDLGRPDIAVGLFHHLFRSGLHWPGHEVLNNMSNMMLKAESRTVEIKLSHTSSHGWEFETWARGGFFTIGTRVSLPACLEQLAEPPYILVRTKDGDFTIYKNGTIKYGSCKHLTAETVGKVRAEADRYLGRLLYNSSEEERPPTNQSGRDFPSRTSGQA